MLMVISWFEHSKQWLCSTNCLFLRELCQWSSIAVTYIPGAFDCPVSSVGTGNRAKEASALATVSAEQSWKPGFALWSPAEGISWVQGRECEFHKLPVSI